METRDRISRISDKNEKPFVSIAGKQGPFRNVINALKPIDLSFAKDKSILLKPNMGRIAKPEHGYNTHPLALAALIESFAKAGASKIAIGESPLVGNNTSDAFQKGGIVEIADKYGIELIDMDLKPPVKKTIPESRVVNETKICRVVYEYDILVSVPVTKTHMHTGVTLGIKNLKGCLYRHEKVRYHQLEYKKKEYPEKTLDSAISDLASILLPDFTVIDGYIGMEGLGPSGGDAIKSDFAVASRHPMGADVFGCLLMGIDPLSVVHLKLVSQRNNFSLDPLSYSVFPDDYQKFIVSYQQPPTDISVKFKNIVVYEKEACSACLSTLFLFLRRFKDEMSPYLLDDGKFHIAIGKGVKDTKDGTIFVGNCARNNKEKCTFIKGCPPVPTRIYEAITGREPDENEPEVQ
jgi:uncharacterized protein (DUF362 family)